MNTAILGDARIVSVDVTDEGVVAHLADGRIISMPLEWSWRLRDATPEQRAHWELIGDGQGVRWPGADEGLSAEGMLRGTPAKRPVRPQDKGVAPPPSETRAATTKLDSRFRGND